LSDLARTGVALTVLVLAILAVFYPLAHLLWWFNDHAPILLFVVGTPLLIFFILGLVLLVGRVIEWVDREDRP